MDGGSGGDGGLADAPLGAPAAAGGGGGWGDPPDPGITTGLLQFGHFTVLPAVVSGALNLVWHFEHCA